MNYQQASERVSACGGSGRQFIIQNSTLQKQTAENEEVEICKHH